jgi:hypothetical protein
MYGLGLRSLAQKLCAENIGEINSRGQFHQRSTCSFNTSKLTPIFLAHSIECINKVGRNLVGETEWQKERLLAHLHFASYGW